MIACSSDVVWTQDRSSFAGHLVVDASTAESDVGGERGGVVVRAEGRLTLGPVLHHKIQRSKTLEGEETRRG